MSGLRSNSGVSIIFRSNLTKFSSLKSLSRFVKLMDMQIVLGSLELPICY